MRISKNYVVQRIADENLVIPIGKASDRLHGIIKLNESGIYLWNKMQMNDCMLEELIDSFTSEYNVSDDIAKNDIESFINTLDDMGCFEDD